MPVPSKALCMIGIVAMVALAAAAADARVNTTRSGGAYNSATTPPAPKHGGAGSITYDADGDPFPTGHGGGGSSPDFQLVR